MNESTIYREDREKDSETLEREVNQTREEMNQTLDSLERKLTAGQLLDQCLKFFGKSGSEIGSSIGNCIKENPMPVALAATGIAWMIFGSGEHRSARGYSGYAGGHIGYSDDGSLGSMGEKLESTATAARSQMASSIQVGKDSVNSTKDAMTEGINRTSDAVKEGVNRTTATVKDTVRRTATSAQMQAERARQGFNSLLEEQPLILGALGIALGAAIGAVLPSTEQEDRLVGEMRDKAMEKAKQLGGEAYEKGRDAAKQGIDSMTGGSGSVSTHHS
jgi:Protein of unknown function (DUF3618)